MAEERIVQRQVAPRAAQPAPSVSAEAMGAGVGRAVEGVGNVIQSERLQDAQLERQLRDNAELADFNVAFAEAREEFSARARESRQTDDPAHAKRIAEEWRQREGELLGRVTSTRVKQQAQGSLASWGGQLREREAAWQEVRQSEIMVDRFDDALRVSEGRTRRLEDPADYRAERDIQMAAIDALAVDDKVKDALRDNADQRLAVAFLRGTTDRDPAITRALIESGEFDGVLTGDQTEVLLNGADVEQRRIAAQLEREQSAVRAQLRERVQVFKQAQSQGLIEEPEAFDEAIAGAMALGDDSLALELEGMKFDTRFVKVWGPENADAVQRERRMAELAAMPERDDAQKRELAFLRKHSGGWASAERSDPVGLAMKRGGGNAPPAISFDDPASLAARGQWASARRVNPLSKTEAEQLGRIYDSGPSGEAQAMAALSRFPAKAAMMAAEQMRPDDKSLPILATLPPFSRQRAIDGRKAIKAKPGIVKDYLEGNLSLSREVEAQRKEFDDALIEFPADQRAAIKQAADQIIASYIDQGEELGEGDFAYALSMAMGATGRGEAGQRGGFQRWGVTLFPLPDGVSKPEFKDEVLRKARTNILKPVNPDGSAANLLRAYPVMVAPGLYEFHTGRDRPILKEGGGAWRVRVGDE